jgi:hypothetical protein
VADPEILKRGWGWVGRSIRRGPVPEIAKNISKKIFWVSNLKFY